MQLLSLLTGISQNIIDGKLQLVVLFFFLAKNEYKICTALPARLEFLFLNSQFNLAISFSMTFKVS